MLPLPAFWFILLGEAQALTISQGITVDRKSTSTPEYNHASRLSSRLEELESIVT